MQNQIPHFKYHQANPTNNFVASIEVDGKEIHKISNLEEFHEAFGYTQDMRKAGVAPDEFIWEEYINSPVNFTACYQIHVIEYLIKHSQTFTKKYGDQFESWLAAHAEVRAKRGVACAACRLKPICDKLK